MLRPILNILLAIVLILFTTVIAIYNTGHSKSNIYLYIILIFLPIILILVAWRVDIGMPDITRLCLKSRYLADMSNSSNPC